MIKFVSTDQNQIKTVLLHYKRLYVPFGIVIVCLLLIFFVLIPQLQQYAQQRSQIKEVEQRITILKNNLSILSAINEEAAAKQLSVVLNALPEDKDFAGILYAVGSASSKAGVGIGDFTFQVGELSAKSVITKNLPTVIMNLNVLGPPQQVEIFLQELAKTFPLSNVTEISLNGTSSQLVVQFYYKPIPQLQVNYAQPMMRFSQSNTNLLNTLTTWKVLEPILDASQPELVGSSSASPFGQ